MKTLIKGLWKTYKRLNIERMCKDVAVQIVEALRNISDEIPVIIVSYQNGLYVEKMVEQLNSFGLTPIIIDNNSKDAQSNLILAELETSRRAHVVRSSHNLGHMVGFLEPIYKHLPEVFGYTDPDLQFNPVLPANFLTDLADLTAEYSVYKVGFALDLLPEHRVTDAQIQYVQMVPFEFRTHVGIRKWESTFWRFKICDRRQLYAAAIDTTFAVYRKTNYTGSFYDAIRVAGDYSAIHLPWFPDLDILPPESRETYLQGNKSSSWTSNA